MTATQIIIGVIIAVVALIAAWRCARAQRSLLWRALLPLLQLAAALAFWLLLFPPETALRLDALTVLTPGASEPQLASLPIAQRAIALPGSDAPSSVERAPDLATALREHPSTLSITVIGRGLPPRDLNAVGARGLSFDAAAPQGIVELDAAAQAAVGTQWTLRGRAAGSATQVQLRDVSGAVVDHAGVGRGGAFVLSAIGRAAGPALFKLQALDKEQSVVDQAGVPVVFRGGAALSMLLRAAGPDPDQKYWRRWARDAGVKLSATIALSDGLMLRDGDVVLDAAALAATDLLVLDERSWAALSADEKAAVLGAVDQGLGLLLRVTGAVEAAVAAEWAQLGLPLIPTDAAGSVSLDRLLGLREPLPLSAAPAKFGERAQAFIRADDGEALAAWSARGQGRIGALLLIDSFRLMLQGEGGRYAGLWGGIVGQLARPRAQLQPPPLPLQAWVDERQTLCQLGEDAHLFDAAQQEQTLLIEHGCAAFWPQLSGWYGLRTATGSWPFYVRAADDAVGLRAARDSAATQALVADAADAASVQGLVPMPRWPFFIAWLLLAALIWWRERRALQAD
ncbi:MAG: hypothetical protein JWQ90_4154 [Hydrocarboniphaga sp.]|uniref:hypothetical protein n=1 Tax=Hydrocarboniphaga sp. TaxID=2033016 RepID=UPI002601D656|nr:hypothetical protein [Hydrocarboniphaga sp.]MDB5971704.1 hypothetical protein [Hydrocarboniphaga sp.]